MAPIWDALRGKAAIVVTGHEHSMQRLRPIDGITSFVSGAGGHGLYDLRRDDPRLAFGDDRHYGALRLRLRRGEARYAYVSSSGRVLDSGTLRCRPLRARLRRSSRSAPRAREPRAAAAAGGRRELEAQQHLGAAALAAADLEAVGLAAP